jgi:hypothetical protein
MTVIVLLQGDIVEYKLTSRERVAGDDGRRLGLGVITWELKVRALRDGAADESSELGCGAESCVVTSAQVHPLCQRAEGSAELYYDEEVDPLPELAQDLVVRILQGTWFSQRVIEDRVRNPHGEEAEDVFFLGEAAGSLSPGCAPVKRYQ